MRELLIDRDVERTLNDMLALIPASETDLRIRLERIIAMSKEKPGDYIWSITAQVLNDGLERFDWVREVRKTFSPHLYS